MAELSPASIDSMAVAAPAGDAMTMAGPTRDVVIGADNQQALPDWKARSMAELGFGAGDAAQMGGRRRRSRKHRSARRHSRRMGGRSRRHMRTRRHSRRH